MAVTASNYILMHKSCSLFILKI